MAQNCNWCGKPYTYDEVKRKHGTIHYAEYGCCCEQCYTNVMTGIPKPPNPESNHPDS